MSAMNTRRRTQLPGSSFENFDLPGADVYQPGMQKELAPQLTAFSELEREVHRNGFVSGGNNTARRIYFAATAIYSMARMKPGNTFLYEKWIEIRDWLAEKAYEYGPEKEEHERDSYSPQDFKKIMYLPFDVAEDFVDSVSQLFFELQVYGGTYLKDAEKFEEDRGHPFECFNWLSVLGAGGFVPNVGSTGCGKSSMMAGLGVEFAKAGYYVATNMGYFGEVATHLEGTTYDDEDDEEGPGKKGKRQPTYPKIRVSTRFSDAIETVAMSLEDQPDRVVPYIVDEIDTLVNAWRQMSKDAADLAMFSYQMRKLGFCLIGIFKNEGDLPKKFRQGFATGGSVPCRIYKGAYLNKFAWKPEEEVSYYGDKHSRHKHALVRFEDRSLGDIEVRKIPGFDAVFETRHISRFEIDIDLKKMLGDLGRLPLPQSMQGRKGYGKKLTKLIRENLTNWLKKGSEKRRTAPLGSLKFTEEERTFMLERAEHHMRENPKKYWPKILADFNEEFKKKVTDDYTRKYLGGELKQLRIRLTDEGVKGLRL